MRLCAEEAESFDKKALKAAEKWIFSFEDAAAASSIYGVNLCSALKA